MTIESVLTLFHMNGGVICFFGQLRPTKMLFKHSVVRDGQLKLENFSNEELKDTLEFLCTSYMTLFLFFPDFFSSFPGLLLFCKKHWSFPNISV
jgi:hypothetical protein